MHRQHKILEEQLEEQIQAITNTVNAYRKTMTERFHAETNIDVKFRIRNEITKTLKRFSEKMGTLGQPIHDDEMSMSVNKLDAFCLRETGNNTAHVVNKFQLDDVLLNIVPIKKLAEETLNKLLTRNSSRDWSSKIAFNAVFNHGEGTEPMNGWPICHFVRLEFMEGVFKDECKLVTMIKKVNPTYYETEEYDISKECAIQLLHQLIEYADKLSFQRSLMGKEKLNTELMRANCANFARELAEKVFHPNRLLRLCEAHGLDLVDYMELLGD